MKAILNLNPKNKVYSLFNGKTFNVLSISHQSVCLEISSEWVNGNSIPTDFAFNEVIIVDIDAEIQKAYDDHNWGQNPQKYIYLKNYCISKKIQTNEIYNAIP